MTNNAVTFTILKLLQMLWYTYKRCGIRSCDLFVLSGYFVFTDIRVLFFITGLKSHPHYELGKRQCRGYSGMVSFYIKGGLQEAETFLSALKV